MPIELLYTDSEILNIRTNLLKQHTLTTEDVQLLGQLNEYINRK